MFFVTSLRYSQRILYFNKLRMHPSITRHSHIGLHVVSCFILWFRQRNQPSLARFWFRFVWTGHFSDTCDLIRPIPIRLYGQSEQLVGLQFFILLGPTTVKIGGGVVGVGPPLKKQITPTANARKKTRGSGFDHPCEVGPDSCKCIHYDIVSFSLFYIACVTLLQL